ncbi:MAG: hypothetical protein ACI8Y9_001459 [Paracoccaceae bacterium]|jgi:hypothetical protein
MNHSAKKKKQTQNLNSPNKHDLDVLNIINTEVNYELNERQKETPRIKKKSKFKNKEVTAVKEESAGNLNEQDVPTSLIIKTLWGLIFLFGFLIFVFLKSKAITSEFPFLENILINYVDLISNTLDYIKNSWYMNKVFLNFTV